MDRATRAGRDAGHPLTNATLGDLPASVSVPTYDRGSLTPAVVHIGVGGFHRAHQGMYFDRLAEHGISCGWGVTGVSLRHSDVKDALAQQDWLYTVVSRGEDADEARVVGALVRHVFAPEDPEAVLELLADPRTRLVTLTITGDGYGVDIERCRFDPSAPGIAEDLRRPDRPTTVNGYLVEGLARRRAAGTPPFTVLSCDNVPHNGRVARAAVTGFARRRDPDLAAWIEEHGAFPGSVVDRITPETTADAHGLIARTFGVADRWPVVTEPFTQWIVEDVFCNGRPPLDRVGAQFVGDVEPYELTKKRLLNGTHCAIGYIGTLAGHRTTSEAMRDPVLHAYAARLMDGEVAPLLPPVPGIDPAAYRVTLRERLGNSKIGDRLARLCRRGSTKMPSYLLPSIADARAAGRPHPHLTLAVAAWFRCLVGLDLDGRPLTVEDPRRDELMALAAAGDLRGFLQAPDLFGALGRDEAFAEEVRRALAALELDGVHGAVRACQQDADGALAA